MISSLANIFSLIALEILQGGICSHSIEKAGHIIRVDAVILSDSEASLCEINSV